MKTPPMFFLTTSKSQNKYITKDSNAQDWRTVRPSSGLSKQVCLREKNNFRENGTNPYL